MLKANVMLLYCTWFHKEAASSMNESNILCSYYTIDINCIVYRYHPADCDKIVFLVFTNFQPKKLNSTENWELKQSRLPQIVPYATQQHLISCLCARLQLAALKACWYYLWIQLCFHFAGITILHSLQARWCIFCLAACPLKALPHPGTVMMTRVLLLAH